MANLTKENLVKRFDILENGCIIVHESDVIKRDGKEISSKTRKVILDPGTQPIHEIETKLKGKGKKKVKGLAEKLWSGNVPRDRRRATAKAKKKK